MKYKFQLSQGVGEQLSQINMKIRKNFSLLEVMIAMFIFAVSITSILIGYRSVMRNIGLADDYSLAAFLCKQKMAEKMLDKNISETALSSLEPINKFDRFRWQQEVSKNNMDLYIIKTIVKFDRWGGERQVELVSTKFKDKK